MAAPMRTSSAGAGCCPPYSNRSDHTDEGALALAAGQGNRLEGRQAAAGRGGQRLGARGRAHHPRSPPSGRGPSGFRSRLRAGYRAGRRAAGLVSVEGGREVTAFPLAHAPPCPPLRSHCSARPPPGTAAATPIQSAIEGWKGSQPSAPRLTLPPQEEAEAAQENKQPLNSPCSCRKRLKEP